MRWHFQSRKVAGDTPSSTAAAAVSIDGSIQVNTEFSLAAWMTDCIFP